MQIKPKIQVHSYQKEFIDSVARHPALVGGYGCGKSQAGLWRGMRLKTFPTHKLGVYAPTYSLLQDIWYPKFREFCETYNLKYVLNESKHFMAIQGFGSVYFKSMDKPESIIGYEAADSIVDEIDTLPKEKAEKVWLRILARQRQKKPKIDGKEQINTCAVMTTPEGFNFVHDKWERKKTKSYVLFRGSTLDNAEFLPPDYIESLKESYDATLLKQYLHGYFVNFNKGQVYYAFKDDIVHADSLKFDPTLPVCLCVDFNVNPMVWLIVQYRGRNNIRVLREIRQNNTNTWSMCQAFCDIVKSELGDMFTEIRVYGDAAGGSKSTNSTYTDYSILTEVLTEAFTQKIRFEVPRANPPVRSRVLCVNNVLSKKYVVMSKDIVELKNDFKEVVYTPKNDIDKKDMERTHASDGFGYFVAQEFPVQHRRESANISIKQR